MSEKKKIMHRRSTGFSSVYASGAISSLIPNGGMFTITFYEDVIGIISETKPSSDEELTITDLEAGDLEPHREDKVRITMRPETAESLCKLLKGQLEAIKAGPNDKGN